MEPKIIYTHNKNWYARIKNWELIIEIPVYLKWDNKFKEQLIIKWQKLFERQKKYNHVKSTDEENVLIFGENVSKWDLWKSAEKELKQILLDYITPIVDEYSAKIWIPYKSIRVWKAKTKRWSCSFDQKLMFNINLIHLPTKYIRYVIVHEICHLKHKNHSSKFWAEVEWFLPDFKQTRKELKKIVVE